jgi:hypothetical protein
MGDGFSMTKDYSCRLATVWQWLYGKPPRELDFSHIFA